MRGDCKRNQSKHNLVAKYKINERLHINMNKVMRYQIIKPLTTDWKTFGKILNEIQQETMVTLNKSMQLCWEYSGFSADYKKQYGNYPNTKDILKYSMLHGYCYNYFKECVKMNTGNLSTTIKIATDKWKDTKKDVEYGKIAISNFKNNCPIEISGKNITLIKNDDCYNVNLSLLSNQYKKELDQTSGQILVAIKATDNTQKVILERILSGEYKISASKLIQYKNKWFLNLSYAFEPQERTLDTNNIMGIDMGIVYPVYMAFNNSFNRYKIEGGEIESFRRQVEHRKNQLYAQSKYCGKGRIGHGIKTRIKPIEFATNKVANFRDTTNHKYSRYVVDMAVKHNCGIIQMEDLKGINKDDAFLKRWSYFDLQSKIKYKAEEQGIKVVAIEPRFTSKRCSDCGYIHPDNRKEQGKFLCIKCGFDANADYNAAKNISTLNIDTIITDTLVKQKQEGEWHPDNKE